MHGPAKQPAKNPEGRSPAEWVTAISTFLLFVATVALVVATALLWANEREHASAIARSNHSAAKGHLEAVMDAHFGTRPCMRYVLRNGLLRPFIAGIPEDHLPDPTGELKLEKDQCLAGLYINGQNNIQVASQWHYIRSEIWPYLNALDNWIDDLSPEGNDRLSFVSSILPFEEGSKRVKEDIRNVADDEGDTICFVTEYARAIQSANSPDFSKTPAGDLVSLGIMHAAPEHCVDQLGKQ